MENHAVVGGLWKGHIITFSIREYNVTAILIP